MHRSCAFAHGMQTSVVQGLGLGVLGSGFWVWGSAFRVLDFGFTAI